MTHRPPGTFLPPTVPEVTGDQQRRLRDLESKQVPRELVPSFEVTATNPAPITVADARQTGRWWSWRGAMRLQYIIATADGVDGGLTVGVRRAGVDVAVLEWTSDGVLRQGFDETWSPGQALDLTAAGGVSLLVVQLQFDGVGNGALSFVIPAGGDEG
jgi:hypothetical protein